MKDLVIIIGKNIKKIREKRNMDLEVMAKILDIEFSALNKLEAGLYDIRAKDLDRLCKLLDVGLEELLKNSEKAETAVEAESETRDQPKEADELEEFKKWCEEIGIPFIENVDSLEVGKEVLEEMLIDSLMYLMRKIPS